MEINYHRRDRQSSMPLLSVNGTGSASNDDSPGNDHGWSDQELEDFSHDPLEGVLRSVLARPRAITRQSCVTSAVFFSALAFIVGFLISYLSFFVFFPPLSVEHRHSQSSFPTNAAEALNKVDPESIREVLRVVSEKYHIAGSDRQFFLANYIHDLWTEHGLPDIKIVPYTVLLSNADEKKPNKIQVVHRESEEVVDGIDIIGRTDDIPIFNAYGKAGTVIGDLVYVNFGRVDDYAYVVKNLSISLKSRIVIARYGSVFRGDIVRRAEDLGAAGVILFSDPHEYSAGNGRVFPDAYWLPGDGVQSGYVRSIRPNGDPTTYGYPSVAGAYRDETLAYLPTIPVQPIGFLDAKKLLKSIKGLKSPKEWIGSIEGVPYNIGPGFIEEQNVVRLEVNNLNSYKKIYNVIGTIPGSLEPDRYVIVGNHRDAWFYGAIDPGTGTTVLLELTRVFGILLKTGWRPRRTILFCSWDAEEHGSIGSSEWVEEHVKLLQNNAVAYVNVDIAVEGNYTLNGAASPSLFELMIEAAKKVPNPNSYEVASGRPTVYDTWLYTSKLSAPGKNVTKPTVQPIGDTSDHSAFIFVAGVAACNFFYKANPSTFPAGNPLYHSVFDAFDAVDKLIDPGFKYHVAIAQVMFETVRLLVDTALVPLNVTTYANEISKAGSAFLAKFRARLQAQNISLDYFNQAVADFSNAANAFSDSLSTKDLNDPLTLRMVNDQLIKVDQAFIMPEGLPLSPYYKHAVISPSTQDLYSGSYFSGLVDLISKIERSDSPQSELWKQFREHLAAITFYINSAAEVINLTF